MLDCGSERMFTAANLHVIAPKDLRTMRPAGRLPFSSVPKAASPVRSEICWPNCRSHLEYPWAKEFCGRKPLSPLRWRCCTIPVDAPGAVKCRIGLDDRNEQSKFRE